MTALNANYLEQYAAIVGTIEDFDPVNGLAIADITRRNPDRGRVTLTKRVYELVDAGVLYEQGLRPKRFIVEDRTALDELTGAPVQQARSDGLTITDENRLLVLKALRAMPGHDCADHADFLAEKTGLDRGCVDATLLDLEAKGHADNRSLDDGFIMWSSTRDGDFWREGRDAEQADEPVAKLDSVELTKARIAGAAKLGRRECQICGGHYRAGDGRVAHHGFQRPGCGYIIGPCYGGKELPFDESKAAIQELIEQTKHNIESTKTLLASDRIGTDFPMSGVRFYTWDGTNNRWGQPDVRWFDHIRFSNREEYEELCEKYADGLKAYNGERGTNTYPDFDKLVERERSAQESYLRGRQSFLKYLEGREAEWDAAYGEPVAAAEPEAAPAEVADTDDKTSGNDAFLDRVADFLGQTQKVHVEARVIADKFGTDSVAIVGAMVGDPRFTLKWGTHPKTGKRVTLFALTSRVEVAESAPEPVPAPEVAAEPVSAPDAPQSAPESDGELADMVADAVRRVLADRLPKADTTALEARIAELEAENARMKIDHDVLLGMHRQLETDYAGVNNKLRRMQALLTEAA